MAKKKRKKKKLSLKRAVERLTAIAEEHLAGLPDEEKDARVAAFSRVDFTARRDSHARPLKNDYTQENRVSARARQ